MCCFSVASPVGILARLFAPRVHVSKTNIFARMLGGERQALAYGMDLQSDAEVAMVLPLPVVVGSGEDAVRFVDLSKTPRMFDELGALFEEPISRQAKSRFSFSLARSKTLVVHEIGAFVASYVPTRADFARLDPRFRLPDVLFDAVPQYDDYGFAVFQLKPDRGASTVHPMALELPTRSPDRLFFPTVHVHDGRFHETAKFDHALYYQHPRAESPRLGMADFEGDAVGWGKPASSYEGIVEPALPLVRRTLRGRMPNADTWIAAR